MDKNILNYKYEIFPTAPQKRLLNTVLRQGKLQWNRAVTIRKKLKAALVSKQFDYIISTLLSTGKSNSQGNRSAAIIKFQECYPGLDFASAAKLYDIKNIVGNTLGDITEELLGNAVLASKIKKQYENESAARQAAKNIERKPGDKLPQLKVYWQLLRAINQYADFAAKLYMDNSFESSKDMSLSTVRFAVSGSAKSQKWITATQPKKGQRDHGATGEPRYKKRAESFGPDQVSGNGNIEDITRKTRDNKQIYITAIKSWVNFVYHRPIPEGSDIKTASVLTKAGRYFIVLSAEVPIEAYAIKPLNEGWAVGINPAETTALTAAMENFKTGERAYIAFHYEFLEKSLDKLEKIQQEMSFKQGPKRKLTEEEIKEKLLRFEKTLKNLTDKEKKKALFKEKERISKIMTFNESGPSRNWRKLSNRVSKLHFHVANQRADVRHKIARFLAETADVIGIGDWEPEREVPYREKLRKLKKDVKNGVEGAQKLLKELEESKSKNGKRNSKTKRREAADRVIASLRAAVKEKAQRSGAYADVAVKEPGMTFTCNVCGAETGPKGKEGLKVRQWTCSKCGTVHDRNINAGFNILHKTMENIETPGEAQAPSPETGKTAARNPIQGATVQSGPIHWFGFRATGQVNMKGGPIISLSLKSLIAMKIAGEVRESATAQADLQTR
ncbi:MAG: RNA-guided endonuclease InsQ/TnpB family protein [bacterium]